MLAEDGSSWMEIIRLKYRVHDKVRLAREGPAPNRKSEGIQ